MFDSGYIIEDSSSEAFSLFETQTQNQKKSNLKNKILSNIADMLDDLYTLKLCPELLLFKHNFLKDFKENKNDEDFLAEIVHIIICRKFLFNSNRVHFRVYKQILTL